MTDSSGAGTDGEHSPAEVGGESAPETEQKANTEPATDVAVTSGTAEATGSIDAPPPAGQGIRRPVVLVGLIALAVLVAVVVQQGLTAGGSAGLPRPSLATASIRTFPVTATASGTVVPASEIGVNFATPGRLTEIDVKVGDHVSKGAVLAKVDSVPAQAAVSGAQGTVDAARTPTERALAQVELARVQGDLAGTSLNAPADGAVRAINGQVGETVPTGPTATPSLPGTTAPVPTPAIAGAASPASPRPFIELANQDGVVVGVAFSAADAPQLSPGQAGELTSPTISGLSVACHVLARASDATVIDGTPRYFVSVTPDTTDTRLLAGMPVDVTITIGQATNVIAVPNQSIYLLDGKPNVDVWLKTHPVTTVVTTGLVGAFLTEVKSGLTDGQQVVLSAPNGLPRAQTSPTT